MRFLVDECTGPKVAAWVRGEGHEVFSVFDQSRGLKDDDILAKAVAEDWVLITNDKDFGELVYRERRRHKGINFLRLADEQAVRKIDVLQRLLAAYPDHRQNQFVTVTETTVRFGS